MKHIAITVSEFKVITRGLAVAAKCTDGDVQLLTDHAITSDDLIRRNELAREAADYVSLAIDLEERRKA